MGALLHGFFEHKGMRHHVAAAFIVFHDGCVANYGRHAHEIDRVDLIATFTNALVGKLQCFLGIGDAVYVLSDAGFRFGHLILLLIP